jgi:hypothetical protein
MYNTSFSAILDGTRYVHLNRLKLITSLTIGEQNKLYYKDGEEGVLIRVSPLAEKSILKLFYLQKKAFYDLIQSSADDIFNFVKYLDTSFPEERIVLSIYGDYVNDVGEFPFSKDHIQESFMGYLSQTSDLEGNYLWGNWYFLKKLGNISYVIRVVESTGLVFLHPVFCLGGFRYIVFKNKYVLKLGHISPKILNDNVIGLDKLDIGMCGYMLKRAELVNF